jgi:hypothetical protein
MSNHVMSVLAENNAWKQCGRHANHRLFYFDYYVYKTCAEQPLTKEGLKMMKTCETYIKGEDQNRRTKFKSTWDGLKKRPKWTNSHQCTNWPFYPLDGLCFFIRRQMGSSQSIFIFCWALYYFFGFLVVFPLDLTSHITTLFIFLPSYILHQPWYFIYYLLLT